MSHCWTFTLNNPTNEIKWKPNLMSYLLYCKQKAPTTGTIHYQGYVQFIAKKQLAGFRSAIPGAHGSKSRGDAKSNIAYIKDDEKKTNIEEPIEHGRCDESLFVAPEQGKRSDLHRFMEAVKAREMSVLEMHEEFPLVMAKYRRWVDEYLGELAAVKRVEIKWPIVLPWVTLEKPDPAEKKRHIWLTGPPDLGKSTLTQRVLKNQKYFKIGTGNRKVGYERYRDEEVIMFDDVFPSREEIISVCDVHDAAENIMGDVRYYNKTWKIGQVRLMIVVTNRKPDYEMDPAVQARVNFIECTPVESFEKEKAAKKAAKKGAIPSDEEVMAAMDRQESKEEKR